MGYFGDQGVYPDRQGNFFLLKSEDLGNLQLHCEDLENLCVQFLKNNTFLSFDE